MFTNQDYQQLLTHFATLDPKIHQILLKQGYRQPPPRRQLFSLLIGAIIGQRIRFTQARRLRGRLYTTLGTDDFTPDQVLTLGLTGLQDPTKVGLDLSKAQLIIKLANQVNAHPLNTPQDVKQLSNQKGIGPWTINNTLLMYSLNEQSTSFLDYLLDEDLIIRRAFVKLYQATTKAERQQIATRWSPYQGLITWYLWQEFS